MHSSINSKDNMKLKKLFFTLALMLGCISASAQTDSTFYIKGPMGRLAARLQLPALQQGEKCPMVILCHGFTANMQGPLFDTISDKLTEAGIGVVRFDFNGHGASEGDFINMTVPNEIDDALAVIAFTRNLPQTASISLLGHSQGGVVSAMTAGRLGKYAIRSVVLMAPAAVLRDDALRGNTMGVVYDPCHAPEYITMPSGHKLGRNYIQTALELPIYETASRYDGPVLVIHGMDDRIVPYTYGERFHQTMKKSEMTLIPGENHGFGANLPYATSVASSWLIKKLKDGK